MKMLSAKAAKEDIACSLGTATPAEHLDKECGKWTYIHHVVQEGESVS